MTQSTTGTAAAQPLPSPKERRRLREAKSLTEEQVAAAVGVTRATVRSWETGRTSPRGRKREAYTRLIGTADATSASTSTSTSTPPAPPPLPVEPPVEMSVEPSVEQPAESLEKAPAESPAEAPTSPHTASPAEAFDALYRHTAAALFRQTYLLTGRRNLSREAVGKAFDLAWQRWPEVAVDRDPVGWVRAAAYEHAMSPWRRARPEHRRADPPPEAPGPRALLDALLSLPPAYRRTLLLHDGVGLGLPETAAETEASTPAAAGRLMTARAAVAEKLPELATATAPAEQAALLHEHLGALARAQPATSLPVPELIRTGSERKAQLWTRAAIAFTVLLIGLTLITLATAPRKYETPQSPAQKVGGVPALGGPQKLTPQDKKLQKKLGGELVHGPARLVPRVG
ncbi:helix-turn-helix domain-containing protein [Streptomyces sp. ITFR-6]|uniref:helix-turn-helix domain-containing protein n=1 Tax=Streptomyces sp. ITFR-6 TaxID=3075197 RepID=UPI00288B5E4D|nr:helix-turn-helix domain-containing protein [Streptomyces sp. ITFR-6]WNI29738.1 helix-turn-helix domain-containing protein [Streptomyces sp. ITFR-6]